MSRELPNPPDRNDDLSTEFAPPTNLASVGADKENPYQTFSSGVDFRNPLDGRIRIQPIKRLERARAILGDQYWLFVGICFIGLLIGGIVPFGLLVGPMACGTFICYRNRMSGRSVKFEDLFQGFNFFGDSLIAFLLLMGILIVLTIPIALFFMMAIFGLFLASEAVGTPIWIASVVALYLCYFVAIIFISAFAYVPITFAFPLIVDRGMKGMDAFKLSWQTAKPLMFPLMLMYMVYGILMAIASMMCYVPVFLLMPLVIVAVYTLYEDIFGMSNKPVSG